MLESANVGKTQLNLTPHQVFESRNKDVTSATAFLSKCSIFPWRKRDPDRRGSLDDEVYFYRSHYDERTKTFTPTGDEA